jgi:hypothetical protein
VYSRLSEYALADSISANALIPSRFKPIGMRYRPCFSRHFGPGPPHIVQLGRYGSRSQRHRRAIASKAPAGLWVANNTRATYESESALMSNLPLGSARLLVGCRGW